MMIPESLNQLVQQAHQQNHKIVLVTGVFDIVHQEHLRFLQNARQSGDMLLIGVESDVRVRQIKGEGRPVHNQLDRVRALEALGLAEYVFVLPDDFSRPEHHRQLLQEIRPAVLAVSSHTKHLEAKQQLMAEIGGEVRIVHQHNPAISTTLLLKQRHTS